MIKSMTAFSSSELLEPPFKINVEARSYNSRYLDISLKIPSGYQIIENNINKLISKTIKRGRIEVIIGIECEFEDSYKYEVNMTRAKSFFEALTLLNNNFDLGGININTLLGVGNIIQPIKIQKNYEKIWDLVNQCLNKVILDMDNMKKEEGKNLAEDLYKRLNYLENILDKIKDKTFNLPTIYRDKIKKKIENLTEGLIEIDNDRILHEASILANRSDISEEIIRSSSHINRFRSIMNEDFPAGKKLNFLVQEFNREFNTMGAKVGVYEISHLIISVKSELEKMREQIQNIE